MPCVQAAYYSSKDPWGADNQMNRTIVYEEKAGSLRGEYQGDRGRKS